ncbi:hypothetical protein K438DRAFT_1777415 [Mycena galopus ATCC 62051]|nr:hypothetical protein K438DRAFT_1777415 [Mycena galopus ATCC 62051]
MPYNEAREGSWWCGLRRAEGKCKEEPAPIRTPIPPLASPSTDTGTRIRTHPAPYGGMEVTLKQRCEDVCNTEIKMTKRAQRRKEGAQYCPRPPLCLASKVQYWYKNVSASGVLYGPLSVKSNYRTIAPSSRVIPAAQQADPCEEPTRTRAPRILCAQTTPEAHLKLVACVLTPEPLTRRRWALSSRWWHSARYKTRPQPHPCNLGDTHNPYSTAPAPSAAFPPSTRARNAETQKGSRDMTECMRRQGNRRTRSAKRRARRNAPRSTEYAEKPRKPLRRKQGNNPNQPLRERVLRGLLQIRLRAPGESLPSPNRRLRFPFVIVFRGRGSSVTVDAEAELSPTRVQSCSRLHLPPQKPPSSFEGARTGSASSTMLSDGMSDSAAGLDFDLDIAPASNDKGGACKGMTEWKWCRSRTTFEARNFPPLLFGGPESPQGGLHNFKAFYSGSANWSDVVALGINCTGPMDIYLRYPWASMFVPKVVSVLPSYPVQPPANRAPDP